MKKFSKYISESSYYMEVDNKWDASSNAKSSEEAVKLLFSKAKEVSWIGSETDGSTIYKVIDKDNHYHHVRVSKRNR